MFEGARRLAPPREARSGTSRRHLVSAKNSNALKAKRFERSKKNCATLGPAARSVVGDKSAPPCFSKELQCAHSEAF
jgi:hypothetical protein